MKFFTRKISINNFEASLECYVKERSPEYDGELLSSVLICPGGGYEFTSDREAEPVALKFLAKGYNAFVLRYSVSPALYPTSLLQVCEAISFIKNSATEFFINPNKISICGFSAGGHLAAVFLTKWNTKYLSELSGKTNEQLRPHAGILCYSVLTTDDKFAHRGSIERLLGDKINDTQSLDNVSPEKNVTKDMPRCFLWQTYDDSLVPVENTLLFMNALAKQKISFESHIFESGVHGLSVADTTSSKIADRNVFVNENIAKWFDLAIKFLEK